MLRSLALALTLAGSAAAAQEVDLGAELYVDACAGCHGMEGLGDGPAAALLTVPAPDLTRLASRAGGEFPRLEVIHVIDGTTGIRSHGGPMPVFGLLMAGEPAVEDAPDGSPVFADRRILALVDYLESIQQ